MCLCEFVQFRVPAGTGETVCSLAEQEGVSASEFMRRAILADVEERKSQASDGPDDASEDQSIAA